MTDILSTCGNVTNVTGKLFELWEREGGVKWLGNNLKQKRGISSKGSPGEFDRLAPSSRLLSPANLVKYLFACAAP